MVKGFKNLRKSDDSSSKDSGSGHYKYSVYMQSKDSKWLNRNLSNNVTGDDEPIEEDIRD